MGMNQCCSSLTCTTFQQFRFISLLQNPQSPVNEIRKFSQDTLTIINLTKHQNRLSLNKTDLKMLPDSGRWMGGTARSHRNASKLHIMAVNTHQWHSWDLAMTPHGSSYTKIWVSKNWLRNLDDNLNTQNCKNLKKLFLHIAEKLTIIQIFNNVNCEIEKLRNKN